ncbi:citrate synthase [Blochmannia endosymbiont of Polyrhachis (Hedomyrma) turneri]|uniref:citrate synthase n=1 Tax=Blochmannia endosymbiont of Polyrhachis (Hedomyrma) turneri TaxID=1505596 RepID=UPI00061A78E5|nr:citrate synthase [Blochmannia endosymbiont of Polyrhachis (Hedomyrma) turneri]AKC59895.1 Citrate synthase [Blochmannia endosymbiont of Polyrhachis (Hedomyrma) turneri]
MVDDFNNNTVTFIAKHDNFTTELDVIPGSMGEKQINIGKLQKHGYCMIDTGLTSTAFCKSKITYINGEKGTLLYRGFPIDQLVKQSTYLEVCYILLYGDIPSDKEHKIFCNIIAKNNTIHDKIKHMLYSFYDKSHPMVMIANAVNALGAFYSSLDISVKKNRNIIACQLIAKMPILAAICNQYLKNENFIYSRNDLSYAANFLNMLINKKYNSDDKVVLEKVMNKILILHADHEQNVSTSTVRMVGSSGANPFSCIAAGISALGGGAHGGANEACLHMLEMIDKVENIPKFIKRAKDKHDPFRLIGFGHRIYRNYDPRALVMRETCCEILQKVKVSDKLFNLFLIAMELEKIALHDQYFIERKLYPNIDFYSGLTLTAMGIPPVMFTVIFAVARTVGWIAHWKEMYDETEEGVKLIRPRQLYNGCKERNFFSHRSALL